MKSGVAAILVASVVAVGCMSAPEKVSNTAGGSAPTDESEHGDPPEPQDSKAESSTAIEEQWRCGDIRLTSTCYPSLGDGSCFGTVKTGKYPAKDTAFRIDGVDRHWYWSRSDKGFDYTFVIARGYGRYYDFRGVPAGEKIKPSGVFPCSETE